MGGPGPGVRPPGRTARASSGGDGVRGADPPAFLETGAEPRPFGCRDLDRIGLGANISGTGRGGRAWWKIDAKGDEPGQAGERMLNLHDPSGQGWGPSGPGPLGSPVTRSGPTRELSARRLRRNIRTAVDATRAGRGPGPRLPGRWRGFGLGDGGRPPPLAGGGPGTPAG